MKKRALPSTDSFSQLCRMTGLLSWKLSIQSWSYQVIWAIRVVSLVSIMSNITGIHRLRWVWTLVLWLGQGHLNCHLTRLNTHPLVENLVSCKVFLFSLLFSYGPKHTSMHNNLILTGLRKLRIFIVTIHLVSTSFQQVICSHKTRQVFLCLCLIN